MIGNLGNLLNVALSVVGRQSFNYIAFTSRTPNAVGQDVATYAAPVALTGSVQPVPRSLYQQYGLDFQRDYLIFYVSQNAIDVTRDVSGDQMQFNGNLYQCVSETDWFPMNGWTAILCVKILAS